ncbi:MAG: GTP 3',8-cyclase MoaA [candidate division Zixibacteria bacterium]|nr:GTP 3',8-cyclase MoaA [candidate division Zixibacteria bacterium]MDH3938402.1 GTP 3',8-cyclase MoaA [candidate division Zixibacteria bacterium]MDH4035406.1 GTP 3',8-cyclase MoaA [candidate division Zixibacteria bacterium]
MESVSPARTTKLPLIDSHGRKVRKLRVSLLEDCNFRCHYCMPLDARFPHRSNRIPPDEIVRLCRILLDYGVEEIRLTGGEPTMRPEFNEIVTRLSELPLKMLALTTNASKLERLLPFLKTTNCKHINISLDSLKEERFNQITHSKHFTRVMRAIEATNDQGFHTKLNVLAMRDVNDDEILDFVDFSERTGIEVRFLELMRIGQARENQISNFIPADDILEIIRGRYQLEVRTASYDSTSINFKTTSGAKIGIIASESKPFCGACSRWRLSSTGKLRPCLMKEEGHDIAYKNDDQLDEVFHKTLKLKPTGRIYEVPQNMNEIGG